MGKRSGKWDEIAEARRVLGLGETASLKEIKAVYHRLSKERHPDARPDQRRQAEAAMSALNQAYGVLLAYGESFPLPLSPDGEHAAPLDAEDWWLDRFGEDPLWGKSEVRSRKPEAGKQKPEN